MPYDKNTINLREKDGSLLNLQQKLLETNPVLKKPSILTLISDKTGKGFTGGKILKKSKRTQTEYTPQSDASKITSGFVGASAQTVGSVIIEKKYRQDSIIGSVVDYAYLKQGKGGDLLAQEIGDFLLVGEELDLKELLELATTQADAMKIYSSVDSTGAPTGNQPTQADALFATALPALKSGKRSVIATNLSDTNAILLVRAAISYLYTMGTVKNEGDGTLYPFSINGASLSQIAILTTYDKMPLLKDSITRTIIDISNPNTNININGIVAYIDSVPVIMTNQLGAKEAFKIMVTSGAPVLVRDLDPVTQYIGAVSQGNGQAIKLANGDVVNVKLSEVVCAMEQGRAMGVKYFEHIFTIKDVE